MVKRLAKTDLTEPHKQYSELDSTRNGKNFYRQNEDAGGKGDFRAGKMSVYANAALLREMGKDL